MKSSPFSITALCMATASFASAATIDTPTAKPNIIVILVDDMGYSDLGVMGSEIKTPNLDRLAKAGTVMTHLYTTARCCPSRASLMTGQYPHAVGMGHMDDTVSEFPSYEGVVPKTVPLLPEVLGDAGYRTLMTGKWHIGNTPDQWPINRGFDRFYGIPAGGGVYFWPPVGLERPVYLNHEQVDPAEVPDWYSTDAFTDHAITFIEESVTDKEPFFLYAAYIAPHFPMQAFPEDIAKYDDVYNEGYAAIRQSLYERQKQLGVLTENYQLSPADAPDWSEVEDTKTEARKMQVYAAMVDRLDQNIGRLVESLEKQGIADNTASSSSPTTAARPPSSTRPPTPKSAVPILLCPMVPTGPTSATPPTANTSATRTKAAPSPRSSRTGPPG